MSSRYLSNLNKAILSANGTTYGDCLRAERAAYLARRGDSAEAESELSALRLDGTHIQSAAVSSWINFAEGMQLHCRGIDHAAIEKWRRCRAIADSAGLNDLSLLVSSWFVFLSYTCANTSLMREDLQRCLNEARKLNNQAKSRLALTIAQCFHVCGCIKDANRWYTLSRLQALEYGDEVMLSALIHNMSWIRVSIARNGMLRGLVLSDSQELIYLGAETTMAYEELVGISSFEAMTPLLQAQVRIMNGQYSVAEQIITQNLEGLVDSGIDRMRSSLLADRAYCRALAGNGNAAMVDIAAALSLIGRDTQIDDLAVLHSRIALAYLTLGIDEKAQMHQVYANRSWAKFEELRDDLLCTAKMADHYYIHL